MLCTKRFYTANEAPQSGHMGIKRTENPLLSKYYGKDLIKTVVEYLISCDIFQRVKATNYRPFGLLQTLEPPQEEWIKITMNFVKPLPK